MAPHASGGVDGVVLLNTYGVVLLSLVWPIGQCTQGQVLVHTTFYTIKHLCWRLAVQERAAATGQSADSTTHCTAILVLVVLVVQQPAVASIAAPYLLIKLVLPSYSGAVQAVVLLGRPHSTA